MMIEADDYIIKIIDYCKNVILNISDLEYKDKDTISNLLNILDDVYYLREIINRNKKYNN